MTGQGMSHCILVWIQAICFINFSANITRIWMAKLRHMQEVGIYEGIKFGVDSNKTLKSTESTDLCQAAGIFNVKISEL